jgi:transketolase
LSQRDKARKPSASATAVLENTGGNAEPRDVPIDELSINTIRTLAMDAVQRANSGHPGTPMALAPVTYALWTRHMRYNPHDPQWFDRDRFVLSAGHASMLLYATLHLCGFDLSLRDLKDFRQWASRTPGHPEAFHAPGVETTTGPLGQGLITSVGMALAEAHLAAVFNREGHDLVHHHTYVIGSDGDLMEGASHEAASLAGHLRLGRLIWIYDDNRITIEGSTDLALSDDVERRFEGYGWHVQNLGDRANDLEALDGAIQAAQQEVARPSLVIIRSHIAYGSPNLQDTAEAHGAPLGDEEIRLTKRAYGWPEDATFLVPDRVSEHMGRALVRGHELQREWEGRLAAYRAAYPQEAAAFEQAIAGIPPDGWDAGIPEFAPGDGPLATRVASGRVLNGFADRVPWLIGGSADLAGSTKTIIGSSESLSARVPSGRNVHWGVREHGMVGACNGMALHGGVRPYAATFFVFTDYARPAIRLSAMMGLPVIYVLTHDSIGLGEDGPTHQPIEHLASLRAMPGIRLIRPADANEVACAWRVAIEHLDRPTMLILSRQKLPILDRTELAAAEGLRRGAYVLSAEKGDRADVLLLASGSEVSLALEASKALAVEGVDARVISMPSWELFREQSREYRDSVLPPDLRCRVAIEAGATQGWLEWVGERGEVIGIDRFGASAPSAELFRRFGFTVDDVVERARRVLEEG